MYDLIQSNWNTLVYIKKILSWSILPASSSTYYCIQDILYQLNSRTKWFVQVILWCQNLKFYYYQPKTTFTFSFSELQNITVHLHFQLFSWFISLTYCFVLHSTHNFAAYYIARKIVESVIVFSTLIFTIIRLTLLLIEIECTSFHCLTWRAIQRSISNAKVNLIKIFAAAANSKII